MCRYQNWPILLPTCPHSCRKTWLPLGFFFGFTKSSLNNCECVPTSIYADFLAEDSPYKCDRVTLEPVEVRENEVLEFDSEAMQCNVKYDQFIQNTDFTEDPPFVVTVDGPTEQSEDVGLDACCLKVLELIENGELESMRHFLDACTKTVDRSASVLTYVESNNFFEQCSQRGQFTDTYSTSEGVQVFQETLTIDDFVPADFCCFEGREEGDPLR